MMPEDEKREDSVTALCPECGTLVEVRDMRALLLTLHQTNDCSVMSSLVGGSD